MMKPLHTGPGLWLKNKETGQVVQIKRPIEENVGESYHPRDVIMQTTSFECDIVHPAIGECLSRDRKFINVSDLDEWDFTERVLYFKEPFDTDHIDVEYLTNMHELGWSLVTTVGNMCIFKWEK